MSTVTTPSYAPLRVGPITAWPPVELAPMAGVTNPAFRQLCREYGSGLFVCEMITTRALVERNAKTMGMISFAPQESPRSLQLYGVDPVVVGRAAQMVVEEDLADHIDLNFGCPVPKVTRKGGGAVLPWHGRLFAGIIEAAVGAVRRAGADIPVTVKMRKGIDEEHLHYLDAGRIAQDCGAAYVALHGRTAAQLYSGQADWDSIGELKSALDIPVLGNGDVVEAEDAIAMMAHTGCDGVVIGRGCLGRPWLFADLQAAFEGSPRRIRPGLGDVATAMYRHAQLLSDWMGEERGVKDFRKHVAWYLKGYPAGGKLRGRLAQSSSLVELRELLDELDADADFPESVIGATRGRTTGERRVALPEGWLDNRDDASSPEGAELETSGG